MANMKQAIKRVRINDKKREANASEKSGARTAVKKLYAAIENNADNIDQLHNNAVKAIDMAQASGIIHANKAAREKSKMAKAVNNAK